MKFLKYFIIGIGLLALVYLVGAKVEIPNLSPEIGPATTSLQDHLTSESEHQLIIPGCEPILRLYNDTTKEKTKFVLLYLHGFSGSPLEGDPLHFYVADKYGMNLYAPRLAAHGLISEDPLLTFTAEAWINSAKQAILHASELGDSIIVMCTSTGATSALFLSNSHPKIHSLICYSPNIDLARTESDLLLGPWGLQLGYLINGGKYYEWNVPEEVQDYWNKKYRIEAVVQLKALLRATMKEDVFRGIKKPLFVGYYAKNEEEKDDQVSIEKMETMFHQAGTAEHQKWFVNFYEAKVHCLPSKYFCQDTLAVQQFTSRFIEEVLGIDKVN